MGAVVHLVEYRTRNREVAGSTHTRSTASNLEQVANLGQLSLPLSAGREMSSSYGYGVKDVADWDDGVSASCIVGPVVC